MSTMVFFRTPSQKEGDGLSQDEIDEHFAPVNLWQTPGFPFMSYLFLILLPVRITGLILGLLELDLGTYAKDMFALLFIIEARYVRDHTISRGFVRSYKILTYLTVLLACTFAVFEVVTLLDSIIVIA